MLGLIVIGPAVERMSCRLGERGTEERPGHDVACIVNAGVHAGLRHQGGERMQRGTRRRRNLGDAGRER